MSIFSWLRKPPPAEAKPAPVHTRYSVRVDVSTETGKQYGHIIVNGHSEWFLGEVRSAAHAQDLAAEKVAELRANEAEVARTWEAG